MTLGLAYWVLMLVWLVFGFIVWAGLLGPGLMWSGSLLLFILLGLLGWQVFGPPLRK